LEEPRGVKLKTRAKGLTPEGRRGGESFAPRSDQRYLRAKLGAWRKVLNRRRAAEEIEMLLNEKEWSTARLLSEGEREDFMATTVDQEETIARSWKVSTGTRVETARTSGSEIITEE